MSKHYRTIVTEAVPRNAKKSKKVMKVVKAKNVQQKKIPMHGKYFNFCQYPHIEWCLLAAYVNVHQIDRVENETKKRNASDDSMSSDDEMDRISDNVRQPRRVSKKPRRGAHEKRFVCKYCGQRYFAEIRLKRHIIDHGITVGVFK